MENRFSNLQPARTTRLCACRQFWIIAGGIHTQLSQGVVTHVENTDLFQQVLGSSSCEDPVRVPD